MFKHRAILIALVALGVLFSSGSSASAGTYNVQQCHTSSGFATAGGWNWGANGFANGLAGCTNAFRMFGNGTTGPGQYLWWSTPTLPSPLKFTNLTYHLMANDQGGVIHNTTRFCTSGTGAFGVCNGHYASQHLGDLDFNFSQACNINGPFNECNRAVFLFNTGDATYKSVNGHFFMNDMTFTINDPTNPTANAPSGGTMNRSLVAQPRGWNRGTVTVNVSGQDGQGGIKSVNSYADGNVNLQPASTTASCSYTTWQPCPLNSNLQASASVNTAVLTANSGDGAHTYTSRAVDAADNASTTSVTFHVDNTQPSDPSNVSGPNGQTTAWSATNDFDVDWSNGSETVETETVSGLSHVVVDLSPVVGTDPDPAPVVVPIGGSASGISATLDSLSGITLPIESRYRYGIGVRDLAGNWSSNVSVDSNNNPTGVTIDTSPTGPSLGYDPNPPAAPGLQSNGWISEADLLSGYSQEWSQSVPQSGSPICGYAGLVDPNPSAEPGTTININGAVNEWTLPSDLAEGTHWVHIRSIGCNGIASSSVSSTDVKVDRTDPVSYVSGVTPGRWYKDNSVVTIGASDVLSGMVASSGPLYFTGAYLDYSVNNVSPAEPARGGEAQIPVSGEGQKELRFAAVDVAGNRNDDTVVNFGIDASNPTGYLESPDPATPTLLRAPLGDEVSGLETAMIDVRRESGSDWINLPTGLADLSGAAVAGNPKSGIASARFPDTKMPEGRYNVRVRTFDQAGNALVTDRDKNGRPLIVDSGAMRTYSGLSATLFKAKRTCKKKKGVKCVKRARGKVVFLGGTSNLTVGFKRGAVVQGFLVDAGTKPLARQPIEIYTTQKGKAEVLAGVTSTKSDGSYVFKLRPGVSRTVRVHYPGTETRRDTSTTVTLGTGAKLTLRVSKRHARTGQTVTFRGSVTSFDRVVPASGKIVALQFYAAKKWRPAVAIARTDSKGRFSVKYKFDGARVKSRIVFRVIAPTEDGWGHATSASRRITMKLN